LRQERLDDAVTNLRSAVQIHPRSSVLRCFLGMALQVRGDERPAVEELKTSLSLDPSNPQPTFQIARIMEAAGNLEEARQFLVATKQRAPREFAVHYALGRVCMLLGRAGEATGHFENAAAVCPSKVNLVKAALARVQAGQPPENNVY
jgi:anaphase-promoting complex subunit 3